mgnify:FL=1
MICPGQEMCGMYVLLFLVLLPIDVLIELLKLNK